VCDRPDQAAQYHILGLLKLRPALLTRHLAGCRVKKLSSVFWDMTPCSPLEEPVPAVSSSACYLLQDGFFLGLFFDFEGGSDMFLRNIGGLHGVISQKIELFITTGGTTSDPT
jgi:hypothetical protein